MRISSLVSADCGYVFPGGALHELATRHGASNASWTRASQDGDATFWISAVAARRWLLGVKIRMADPCVNKAPSASTGPRKGAAGRVCVANTWTAHVS